MGTTRFISVCCPHDSSGSGVVCSPVRDWLFASLGTCSVKALLRPPSRSQAEEEG